MKWLFMILVFVGGTFYLLNQRKQAAIEADKFRLEQSQAVKVQDPALPAEQAKSTALKFSPQTLTTLRSLTTDSNEKVRLASVELLWQIQDEEAVGIIKAMFENETEPATKKQIIEMLAKDKNKMSLGLISEALKDSDKDVRIAAVEAIGGYSTKEAIPALNHALKDYDEEVRLKALKAVDTIRTAIEDIHKEQVEALEAQRKEKGLPKQINQSPEDIKIK